MVEGKECVPTLQEPCSVTLWVSSLLLSSPQDSCRDQVICCNFLWPMSAWCPKITVSWGDAWPSTNMRNAYISALAALQILADGIFLAKWKVPATQSKPKSKLSRLRAFSFPQKSDIWLNNSGSLQSPIKLNLLSTSFIFPWHHVYLTCKKHSPLSVITSPFTSFKRAKKKKEKRFEFPSSFSDPKRAVRPQKFSPMFISRKTEFDRPRCFSVVMYGCESWTIKKTECWRIDAFELWCWRRLLRVPWTARRSNQSILKKISPEYSLEGLMLKLKLQYFGHLMWRTDSFEKTLMLGKTEGRRRRG